MKKITPREDEGRFELCKRASELAQEKDQDIELEYKGVKIIVHPESHWKDLVEKLFFLEKLEGGLGTDFLKLLSDLRQE